MRHQLVGVHHDQQHTQAINEKLPQLSRRNSIRRPQAPRHRHDLRLHLPATTPSDSDSQQHTDAINDDQLDAIGHEHPDTVGWFIGCVAAIGFVAASFININTPSATTTRTPSPVQHGR
jgi:hypothetical protein